MNNFTYFLDNLSVLSFVKVFFIVGLGLYAFFAYLMLRQVGVMSRAVEMQDEYIVKIIGIAHFLLAVFILLIALLVL